MRLIEFRALNGTDFNNLVTNAADMLLYNPFVCTTESAYVGPMIHRIPLRHIPLTRILVLLRLLSPVKMTAKKM